MLKVINLPILMLNNSPSYLICNGDANSYITHGGLPFNLFKEAKRQGLIDNAVSLNYKKLKYWKYAWNLIQIIKYGKPGGFQYSEFYSRKIIKQLVNLSDGKIKILSIYPLIPAYPWSKKWAIYFYIDYTIHQIFNEYNQSNLISESFKNKVIKRERLNYLKANHIICRSKAARSSLLKDYKIDQRKISIVPGGANLDLSCINRDELYTIPTEPSSEKPIILGFIGLDWNRKGGMFLIKLADFFKKMKVPLEIRVVGPRKNNLPNHSSLKYVGFIDKSRELDNFIQEVTSWHFGTLFSKAEAFGISNRECMLLGVPVICHDVGGISSTLPESNFGMLFEANPSPDKVYEWIMNILNPYSKYIFLRKKLFENYDLFTWNHTVNYLKEILEDGN